MHTINFKLSFFQTNNFLTQAIINDQVNEEYIEMDGYTFILGEISSDGHSTKQDAVCTEEKQILDFELQNLLDSGWKLKSG